MPVGALTPPQPSPWTWQATCHARAAADRAQACHAARRAASRGLLAHVPMMSTMMDLRTAKYAPMKSSPAAGSSTQLAACKHSKR